MTDQVKPSWDMRIAHYQALYGIAKDSWNRAQSWRDKRESKKLWYVSVEDDDKLFDELQRWLIRDVSPMDQRSIIAQTDRDFDSSYSDFVYSLELVGDADFVSQIELDGHMIDVEITTREPGESKRRGSRPFSTQEVLEALSPGSSLSMMDRVAGYNKNRRVLFTCKTSNERELVINRLASMTTELAKRQPSFNIATSFGSWKQSSTVMHRPLDSVILADDAVARVVADFERFLSTEQRYLELGLPWHHGYLFEGPPGTGKTSLGTALASKYKRDVYYVPLSSIESDSKFMECISGIESKKAVLIIEDIDIVSAARDRDDDRKGVTMTGLLNTLDGMSTPHGLVIILTTNAREVLDPALIRPGRVDMELHIGYVTDEQLQQLCERFIGRRVDLPRITGKITPAHVVGIFKNGDGAEVDQELTELVLAANADALNENDVVQTTVSAIQSYSTTTRPPRPRPRRKDAQ